MKQLLAAIDLGASGGRCALGVYDGDKVTLEMVHRFSNGPIEACGHWYWDMLGLYQNIKEGLAKSAVLYDGKILSVGVDSWGVDFALLDRQGKLAGNPYSSRDPQFQGIYDQIYLHISKQELFQAAGIQSMEYNSLCQLMAMKLRQDPAYQCAGSYLHIADLMNCWLSGEKRCEYTNASTSQLLDVHTRDWSEKILNALDFPADIFPKIAQPGEMIGRLRAGVCEEIGLGAIPVIATASHDTAAAVLAVPSRGDRFGYLSSGTWGLLGRELKQPLVNERVLEYNLANEGGAFKTITFLKNIANLWFVQEFRRIWRLRGEEFSWDQLTQMAELAAPFQAFIDPDDPEFMLPGDIPNKIQRKCQETCQPVPQSKGEILRVVYESLAFKYRFINDRLSDVTGQKIDTMHIVGGGSQNPLLNQFSANALGIPVSAGPIEATTLGNLIVQMISSGLLKSIAEGRELVRISYPTKTFWPEETDRWNEGYRLFLTRTGLEIKG